jgi:hypothetical protein
LNQLRFTFEPRDVCAGTALHNSQAVPLWSTILVKGHSPRAGEDIYISDTLGQRTRHINLNMFSLTPLFIATGFPFSSSIPAAPPSPDIPSSFWRSSSSSWAIVFLRLSCLVASSSWFSEGRTAADELEEVEEGFVALLICGDVDRGRWF